MFTTYSLPLLTVLLFVYITADGWSEVFGFSARQGRIATVVFGGVLLSAMLVAQILVPK